jgi:hypothetical protein
MPAFGSDPLVQLLNLTHYLSKDGLFMDMVHKLRGEKAFSWFRDFNGCVS